MRKPSFNCFLNSISDSLVVSSSESNSSSSSSSTSSNQPKKGESGIRRNLGKRNSVRQGEKEGGRQIERSECEKSITKVSILRLYVGGGGGGGARVLSPAARFWPASAPATSTAAAAAALPLLFRLPLPFYLGGFVSEMKEGREGGQMQGRRRGI